jgi:uncharacterized RmlC-like cupin family protein
MSYGPAGYATTQTFNMEAPGAPGVMLWQSADNEVTFKITPPAGNVGGTALNDLKHAEIYVFLGGEDEAVYYAEHFDEAANVPGAQHFFRPFASPETPIQESVSIPSYGPSYVCIARAADHEISG